MALANTGAIVISSFMIKRDGVKIMNERSSNTSVAKETLDILKQKNYVGPSGKIVDITNEIDYAINGTIYYKDGIAPKGPYINQVSPVIKVTNETTAQASFRLLNEGKNRVVALNFASARNPGGGFLSGAIAQEEDLCRDSALYPCVKSKPLFYNSNIMCEDTFYTDDIIYSPQVPFFRNKDRTFFDTPYNVSIISSPAPNVRSMENVDETILASKLYDRAIKILQVAVANNHNNIILGAWGCGAFGNNPEMVSQTFLDALKAVPAFEHICFAVYDTRENTPVFNTFNKVING